MMEESWLFCFFFPPTTRQNDVLFMFVFYLCACEGAVLSSQVIHPDLHLTPNRYISVSSSDFLLKNVTRWLHKLESNNKKLSTPETFKHFLFADKIQMFSTFFIFCGLL